MADGQFLQEETKIEADHDNFYYYYFVPELLVELIIYFPSSGTRNGTTTYVYCFYFVAEATSVLLLYETPAPHNKKSLAGIYHFLPAPKIENTALTRF